MSSQEKAGKAQQRLKVAAELEQRNLGLISEDAIEALGELLNATADIRSRAGKLRIMVAALHRDWAEARARIEEKVDMLTNAQTQEAAHKLMTVIVTQTMEVVRRIDADQADDEEDEVIDLTDPRDRG